jgi:hypothetical protein
MNDLTILEGWGMVSLIIISGLGGYGLGASMKQFFEDRVEPKWLTTLCVVLATACTCGGTALAVYWAMTNK